MATSLRIINPVLLLLLDTANEGTPPVRSAGKQDQYRLHVSNVLKSGSLNL